MRTIAALVLTALASLPALAQNFPQSALHAKKVIVLNDTHSFAVEKGAETQLKQWGRFAVVSDIDDADLVLSFTKKTGHTTQSDQKTDSSGKSSEYGVTLTSETTVQMTASTRDGFAPFYTTSTHEDKEKAGHDCVTAFISAWLDASRAAERH